MPATLLPYYVEGLFISSQNVRKKRRMGSLPANSIEPYAKTIWANSANEAIQVATQELHGGEWTKPPKVSQQTEEQRMRSIGSPELPGLLTPPTKKHKSKGG